MLVRNCSLALIITLGAAAGVTGSEYARPELLIEPRELTARDGARQSVVLDARNKEAYDAGHIPAARWVDHDEWKSAFGDGEDSNAWSQRIGRLGIDDDSTVVVYDDRASKNAARIWWLLRYWGLRDVKLLNGGWKAWKAAEFPQSSSAPPQADVGDFFAVPRWRQLITKGEVLDALAGESLQIVDTRSQDEHCGEEMRDNERGGSIPGAVHLEWKDLLNPDTDRFKPAEELKRLFEKSRIDLARPVAAHCQSGGRASVMVFAMQLMGAEEARNYYPGWSEWGNDETLPLVVPE